jgi:hypothetical protein
MKLLKSTPVVLCAFIAFSLGQSAIANTLCVNPTGASGCYATIGAAVAAAAANDRINIAAGQYFEDVVITKTLALVGASADSTIINAKGLSNGIYVDGLDHPGLFNVMITGLTVMNANYEGILVTNTSYALISNNHVSNNNQGLNASAGTCPGLLPFETNEATDCGEGIHLVGTDHATVTANIVELNSGGILVSDETGQTYANQITGNAIHDNVLACGITLASHPPAPGGSSSPYGVFNNKIVHNNSSRNGLIAIGAGIGVYAAGPGNQAYGNEMIGNVIEGNGIAGIAVHNHAAPPGAPGINLNDIVIVGNYIAGNGADTQDAATPGTAGINIYGVAPIYGTIILDNTIENQDVGVVMNNPGGMEVHQNSLLVGKSGVVNLGKGTMNGALNFFGCAGGPGTTGCSAATGPALLSSPWLAAPSAAAPPGRLRPVPY